jgi:hypothetical protein
MPQRIQRKRTKGWKMPEGVVYVGRPTIFGNPFPISADYDAIAMFERWLAGERGTGGGGLRRIALLSRLSGLRGKDLACWCKEGARCHADILLKLANG